MLYTIAAGICTRCFEHEKERKEMGRDNLTIDPDTFFGDARAHNKTEGRDTTSL